jgi:competence CoiA-like predicted nuclease
MLYAVNGMGEKIKATPNASAMCPFCETRVRPRCGEIKRHHWSHISKMKCDTWRHGESDWHLGWKSLFLPEYTEVTVGCHRADVKTQDGIVIEFQNSPISTEEIREREEFYGDKMLWVFNGENFKQRFSIKEDAILEPDFEWKRKKKSLLFARNPIFIDFPGISGKSSMYWIQDMCLGFGKSINRDRFIEKYTRHK